jgi:predicted aminopeptidase
MKITKTQLQRLIREEMENLKNEGYMDAYDRSNDEEARAKRERMRRIRAEDERKRQKAKGGGSAYDSFFTGNRDDESADHREDHNIDDLWAMVRNLRRELDDLRDKK